MLNEEQIRFLLDLLSRPVVVDETPEFPYVVLGPSRIGYSDNPLIGSIQVALSIQLQSRTMPR